MEFSGSSNLGEADIDGLLNRMHHALNRAGSHDGGVSLSAHFFATLLACPCRRMCSSDTPLRPASVGAVRSHSRLSGSHRSRSNLPARAQPRAAPHTLFPSALVLQPRLSRRMPQAGQRRCELKTLRRPLSPLEASRRQRAFLQHVVPRLRRHRFPRRWVCAARRLTLALEGPLRTASLSMLPGTEAWTALSSSRRTPKPPLMVPKRLPR